MHLVHVPVHDIHNTGTQNSLNILVCMDCMHIDNWRVRQFNASEKSGEINSFSPLSAPLQDNALPIKFSQIERKSMLFPCLCSTKHALSVKCRDGKASGGRLGRPLKSGLSTGVTPTWPYHAWLVAHSLPRCVTLAVRHFTRWQAHLPGRLTYLADSLTWQTHLPGRLTYLADSLTWQPHLSDRITYLAGSLTWQAHLPGRLTYLTDSLARRHTRRYHGTRRSLWGEAWRDSD
jgi:hypothetical protein